MASRLVPSPTAFATTSRKTKREPIKSESHLDFVRKLPCIVTGSYQNIEAAHISYPNYAYGKLGRGMGRKEHDCWVVPLSREQHALQHSMNEREFWALAKIDPCRSAAALWIASGDRDTALLILSHARDTQ